MSDEDLEDRILFGLGKREREIAAELQAYRKWRKG